MFAFRFIVDYFRAKHVVPTVWTHIVLNYIGPNDGQGIRVYYDGVQVDSATTTEATPHSTADGRIVVGRWYTDFEGDYSGVQVDELLFFNGTLSSDDINALYTAA